ncbi:PREDICTED: protein DVR-1-like [Tinamus guttatus]|uniref:protein DVR-1-like n=1 Tax=Tinamus guttatus TaxID=94827 RepID=UPI00052EC353|nr:PREDICTED: protein DVR-1-like [Tinamus guttatus]
MRPRSVRAAVRAALACALLGALLATELSPQERLLLKSLGLSAKPSPKRPGPVPSVLWRIFQRRRTAPSSSGGPEDACRVEEFNVPGNIIRVFADQGHFVPRAPELCLQKQLFFNLSALEEGERLTMAQLELRFDFQLFLKPALMAQPRLLPDK